MQESFSACRQESLVSLKKQVMCQKILLPGFPENPSAPALRKGGVPPWRDSQGVQDFSEDVR